MLLTARIKIKPQNYNWLNKAANEVNFVWNYCRWIAEKAKRDRNKWLSPFDLINLTSGSSKEFERIGSANISKTASEYGTRRNQFKRLKLKFRGKKSLGWIPLKPEQIVKVKGNGFTFCKKRIRLFEELPKGKLKEGCFAQDSLGDWWFCVPYEIKESSIKYEYDSAGIDIGLKLTAVTSAGDKLESDFYRELGGKLGNLQKRGHKKQAKYLHRKIARKRNHLIHNFSRKIVNKYKNIFIGDVNFEFLKSATKAKASRPAEMFKS